MTLIIFEDLRHGNLEYKIPNVICNVRTILHTLDVCSDENECILTLMFVFSIFKCRADMMMMIWWLSCCCMLYVYFYVWTVLYVLPNSMNVGGQKLSNKKRRREKIIRHRASFGKTKLAPFFFLKNNIILFLLQYKPAKIPSPKENWFFRRRLSF